MAQAQPKRYELGTQQLVALQSTMGGRALGAGDDGYDIARRIRM